ncbi:U3 snoRNP protein, partial [Kickxella alabastrina]
QALLNWLADATQRFPGSDRLWHRRLAALIAAQAEPGLSGSSGAARIERLFECEALPAVAQSKLVWDLWLGWTEQRFSAGDISADRVQARYLSAFIRAAQLGAEHEQLKAHLQCRYVSWAWGLPAHVHLRTAAEISAAGASIDDSGSDGDGDGGSDSGTGHPKARNIAAFRRAYSNVARHAFPTLGFYSRCLQLEPELKQKTLLHEMACRVSPAKQAQWLSYLRFLIENRKLDSAAAVFWRASKALRSDEDRAAFDTAYQSLLQEEAASKSS